MTQSSTIKLFLPFDDPKRIRIAEISNWSGLALASPRSDLAHFLAREELSKPGVYFLLGVDPEDDKAMAYIGEAESVSERIKQQRPKDFWNTAITFVSKDENLTRAHIRYLEGCLIEKAKNIGRYKINNFQMSGARLPESDQSDMGVFLKCMTQLLPILGTDILAPIVVSEKRGQDIPVFACAMKGAIAKGERVPNGFVVFAGSTAVLEDRASAKKQGPWVIALRNKLKDEDALQEKSGFLVFTRDVEFSSPSAAAAVIHGGTAAGPLAWKDANGRTLKEIEEGD